MPPSGENTLESSAYVLRRRRSLWSGDRIFAYVLRVFSLTVWLLLVSLVVFLWHLSWPALHKAGFSFLTNSNWDPVQEDFGALSFVYGTVVSSALALALSLPVSLGTALFLSDLAPKRLARVLGFGVEMLAAIPSVVYGLWGLFVVAPLLREYVQPFLKEHFGFVPLFEGPPFGIGMLCAGIILAIMITPTIASLCRELFLTVPRHQKEASLALGATRWESLSLSVLKANIPGIFGAVILGLGRALGETMAVTMVIGNRPEIKASLFAPAQSMASVIANEYAEATSDTHLAALTGVGLLLLGVSLIVNSLARFMIRGHRHKGSP